MLYTALLLYANCVHAQYETRPQSESNSGALQSGGTRPLAGSDYNQEGFAEVAAGLGDAPIANSPVAAPPAFDPFKSPRAAASSPSGEELNSLPNNSPPFLSSPAGDDRSGNGCSSVGHSGIPNPTQGAPGAPLSLGTILIPISGVGASAPRGRYSPPNVESSSSAADTETGSGGYHSKRH
ncbi:hypothetical protein V3C99_006546 [Haemonchus contortus]